MAEKHGTYYSEEMKSPWGRHMVERFFDKDDDLYAILSNGEIWLKPSNQEKWRRILAAIGHVKAIAASEHKLMPLSNFK